MKRLLVLAAVALLATSALAQTGAQMGGMQPVPASDGTVLVQQPGVGVVAASSAGVLRWTWDSEAVMHSIAVAGERVFVVTSPSRHGAHGMMGRGPGSTTQEIVALSLATGAVRWRREVQGMTSGITVAGDRVYVATGNAGAPELVAIDAATGALFWSVALR